MMYLSPLDREAWETSDDGDSSPSKDTAQCWARERDQYKADGDTSVGRQECRERQQAQEEILRAVRPVLESLANGLDQGGFLGVWADPDGVILHRNGGGSFLSTAQRVQLLEGARWGESTRGINAIGTALEEGREVAVLGHAHSLSANHDLVCYAAPVFGSSGQLLGVLDATSRQECAHSMASAAVVAAKRAIELSVRHSTYNSRFPGGLEGLRRIFDRCSSPALLIERDTTIRLANDRARALIGAQTHAPRGLEWSALLRLSKHPETMDLVGVGGVRCSVWPCVEWVYDQHQPIAALVFLESVQKRRHLVSSQHAHRTSPALDSLFGHDPTFLKAKERIQRLASTPIPVVFLAETGTGKENAARAIHQLSKRSSGPFVPVNCGTFTGSLLESELFGHAPGAFTGANSRGARGKVAAAERGTLFLDEVAELSLSAQAALLRVLEDGSYYRVGDATMRRADVRVVAATCRDLADMVERGEMRSDLYFRLKGAKVTLPPLRERTDLDALILHLLDELAREQGVAPPEISQACWDLLCAYTWPGNVRELRYSLQVAWVMSDGDVIEPEHIPEDIHLSATLREAPRLVPASSPASATRDHAEREALERALEQAQGNRSQVARILGVARSTVYRMMRKYNL